MMCLSSPMNSMATDYNDYLYGNKIVGMSASASSFGGKIAGGLGSAMIGWILAGVGYDAAATTASTAVRYGIYSFSIYLPLVLLVLMFLLTTRFDLESKYVDIMKTVHERKALTTEE